MATVELTRPQPDDAYIEYVSTSVPGYDHVKVTFWRNTEGVGVATVDQAVWDGWLSHVADAYKITGPEPAPKPATKRAPAKKAASKAKGK